SIRLERGARVDLRVSSAGLATLQRPDCLAGERVDLVMSEGASIEVRVEDQAGIAVPGTSVRVWRWVEDTSSIFDRTTVTDADGRARCDGLPGSTVARVAVVPEFLAIPRTTSVPVPRRGVASITVRVREGRAIRGRVRDAETGRPVAKARVGIGWSLVR